MICTFIFLDFLCSDAGNWTQKKILEVKMKWIIDNIKQVWYFAGRWRAARVDVVIPQLSTPTASSPPVGTWASGWRLCASQRRAKWSLSTFLSEYRTFHSYASPLIIWLAMSRMVLADSSSLAYKCCWQQAWTAEEILPAVPCFTVLLILEYIS